MNISWYNSIPVLKNSIHNTVVYSATNRKPGYLDGFAMDRYEISDVNLGKSG